MRLHYALISWLSRTAFRLGCGLRATGLENVPRSESVILASNHRSNFDPPLLGGIVPREVHFFAKEELFRRKLIGSFLKSLNAFPVKRGQLDRKSLSTSLKVLADGGALVFFPEGTRAPEDGFLKAKMGLGWVVCRSKAQVVPVYIHGSNVDGIKLSKRPRVDMVFGKPVSAAELMQDLEENREAYQIVSERVLELIRSLSLETPDHRVVRRGEIFDRDFIEDERLR